jgi:hypothetical protein
MGILMRTWLRKTLAGAGLLFVVALGGVTLSLAHENVPPELGHVAMTSQVVLHKSFRASGAAFQARLDCESSDLPPPSPNTSQEPGRLLNAPDSRGSGALARRNIYLPKVSLHMLDSVLLI